MASAGDAKAGRQTAHLLEREVTKTVRYEYLLYLPVGYGAGSGKWPMVLFLHGAGERGSDLEFVKRHGPPKLVEDAGEGTRDFSFVLVSPQCPEGEWWMPDALAALVDEVVERYEVDEARIYVTGLSMGGRGTWDLAMTHPRRFAAIAPVCGWAHPFGAMRIKHIPVWAFHGALDPVVPIEKAVGVVRALEEMGADVRFTVYPKAGHDSWTETYDNPELYSWLLAQKAGPPGDAGACGA